MEIRVKNGACGNLHDLNFVLASGKITAITGKGKTQLLHLLNLDTKMTGSIYFDGVRKLLKNQSLFRTKTFLVEEDFTHVPFLSTVEEYFLFFISYYHISCQDPIKKMKDALKIVGLPSHLFTTSLQALSSAEQKLLAISLGLLLNPEVLLLDEPFYNLDLKNEKHIARVLIKLKEKYKKTIIFATHDCEQIYQYADEVLFLEEGTVLKKGVVEEVYLEEAFLTKHHMEIPRAISFANFVKKKKQISLGYYKDIRDLIKDIYRNV